jgi:hypothetical protein
MKKIEIEILEIDVINGYISSKVTVLDGDSCIEMKPIRECKMTMHMEGSATSIRFSPMNGKRYIGNMTDEERDMAATMLRCFGSGVLRTFSEEVLYHWTT